MAMLRKDLIDSHFKEQVADEYTSAESFSDKYETKREKSFISLREHRFGKQ